MNLQLEDTRIDRDIFAVRVIGIVAAGEEGHELERSILVLLDFGVRKLILDLCGVEQLDMGGAEILIRCASALRRSGGELRIAAANPKVAALFTATGLDKSLPYYRTVAAAAASFERKNEQ